MEKFGDRVPYYDTDHVIFVEKPGEWQPPTRNIVVDWMTERRKEIPHGLLYSGRARGGQLWDKHGMNENWSNAILN